MLVSLYPLLFAAFGWGVLLVSNSNRALQILASLIIVYCILNLYWPPMHTREAIAAGEKSLSDTLHIVWAILSVLFFMLIMGYGALAFGQKFLIYTIVSIAFLILFGILTGIQAPALESNLPTPMMGIWERINIGIFMLWVIVIALILLRKTNSEIDNDKYLINQKLPRWFPQ